MKLFICGMAVLLCLAPPTEAADAEMDRSHYASLDLYQFKALLESDRILSAIQAGWEIRGRYVDLRGATNHYRITGSTAGNPFIADALRARGLEMDVGEVEMHDYPMSSMWFEPGAPGQLTLLIIVLILHVVVQTAFLLVVALKLRRGNV